MKLKSAKQIGARASAFASSSAQKQDALLPADGLPAQTGAETESPDVSVKVAEDIRIMFQGQMVRFNKDDTIDDPMIAQYLVDTCAPVEVTVLATEAKEGE